MPATAPLPSPEWRDIGHGVRMRLWRGEEGGPIEGMVYEHPTVGKPERTCRSSITFAGHGWPGDNWTVDSLDPLTLSPSLACRRCGHHGFVKEGKWVPA